VKSISKNLGVTLSGEVTREASVSDGTSPYPEFRPACADAPIRVNANRPCELWNNPLLSIGY
jgi:hypothetical protein